MSAVTWANLPYSISNSETIAAYIAAQFATHNNDMSAHGQSNEAIFNHRIAEILDHLDESIINPKIEIKARAYTFIVDPNGDGDYVYLDEALNAVALLGGGTLLLMPGEHLVYDEFDVQSNTELIGFDLETTFIDCAAGADNLYAYGSAGSHLKNISFKNITFKNNISSTYGIIDAYYVDNLTIENCVFQNNTNVGHTAGRSIRTQNSTNIKIKNCQFSENYKALRFDNSSNIQITSNTFATIYSYVLEAVTCGTIYFNFNEVTDSKNYIIYSTSANSSFQIQSNDFGFPLTSVIRLTGSAPHQIINNHWNGQNNVSYGIYLSGSNYSLIQGNVGFSNQIDGIYVTNCYHPIITGNNFTECIRYGINLAASNVYSAIVVANQINDCGTAGLHNLGTTTEQGHNVI